MSKKIAAIVMVVCMVTCMLPFSMTRAAYGDEFNESYDEIYDDEYGDEGEYPEYSDEENYEYPDGEYSEEPDEDESDDEEPEFDDDVLIEVGANDSLETATELENDVPVYGAIADEDDVDYYVFNMAECGHFSFTFNNIDSGKSKWKITILDYAGEEMTSFTTSTKKQIYETQNYNFGVGEKSTVYVRVEYVNRLDDMYTITVNAEEDDTWEQEPDNSYSKAFKIKKGTTYSGNLFSETDKDYFLYKATAKGTAKVKFSLDEQDEDIENGWNLYVYNSAKKLIKSSKNIKSDRTIGFKVSKNCKYYIIIRPASKSKAPVGVDYELQVR